jgi:hypothetical protein
MGVLCMSGWCDVKPHVYGGSGEWGDGVTRVGVYQPRNEQDTIESSWVGSESKPRGFTHVCILSRNCGVASRGCLDCAVKEDMVDSFGAAAKCPRGHATHVTSLR